MVREAVVDANLLVLLIVGSVQPELIGRHKRLGQFEVEDYYMLLDLLRDVDRVVVTPNTLTETSNLLGFAGRANTVQLAEGLRRFIDSCAEVYVPSDEAMRRSEFVYLGLTDVGLLEIVSRDRPLLTVDGRLHSAASLIAPEGAVNISSLLANAH